jgi:hypothetical protein
LRCREQANAARKRLQFKKDLGTASLMLIIQTPNILNKLIVHTPECVSQRLDERLFILSRVRKDRTHLVHVLE